MRSFSALVVLIGTRLVSGDPCEEICALIPGVCSSKGSYCKNEYACMDLFWFADRTVLCSSGQPGCVGKRELLCSEAQKIVETRNREGVVSVGAAGSTTTSRPTVLTTTTSLPSTTIGSTRTTTETTTRGPVITTSERDTELRRVLEEGRRILSASNAELESAPVDSNINALLVPNIGSNGKTKFSGIRDDAAIVLPMLSRALGESQDACLYLFEFLIDPVSWFWFTQSSVATLRDCVGVLVASNPDVTDGVLIESISRVIQVVYSPAIERFVRIPRPSTVPSEFASRALYRQSLTDLTGATDPISRQVIAQIQATTIREYSRFLSSRESQFLNRLIESNFRHPSLSYLPNFVHFKNVPLFLSRLILESVPDYDGIDLDQMSGLDPARVGVYWNHMTQLEVTRENVMDNYQAWLNAAGSFLFLIWDTNKDDESRSAVYNNCLSAGFFETYSRELPGGRIRTRSDLSYIFRFLKSAAGNPKERYQCFYESLVSGLLTVPEGTVGRLTYFLHATTGAGRWW